MTLIWRSSDITCISLANIFQYPIVWKIMNIIVWRQNEKSQTLWIRFTFWLNDYWYQCLYWLITMTFVACRPGSGCGWGLLPASTARGPGHLPWADRTSVKGSMTRVVCYTVFRKYCMVQASRSFCTDLATCVLKAAYGSWSTSTVNGIDKVILESQIL